MVVGRLRLEIGDWVWVTWFWASNRAVKLVVVVGIGFEKAEGKREWAAKLGIVVVGFGNGRKGGCCCCWWGDGGRSMDLVREIETGVLIEREGRLMLEEMEMEMKMKNKIKNKAKTKTKTKKIVNERVMKAEDGGGTRPNRTVDDE